MKIANIGGVIHVTGQCCADNDCPNCAHRVHMTVVPGGAVATACENCDSEKWSGAPKPIAVPAVREPTRGWRRLVYWRQPSIDVLVVPVGSTIEPHSYHTLLRDDAPIMDAVHALRELADKLEKAENSFTGKVDEALEKRLEQDIPF